MFQPFRSAGANEVVPALLQQGSEHLVAHLCHIFRDCLARGYVPKTCRKVKVTFTSKPRKVNYTKTKAYCPNNLWSFMLKMIQKLVKRHITDKILRFYPLHRNQSAYQPGKSTETALHNVVTYRESSGTQGNSTLSFPRH
jgi:hypothetical protein